MTSHSKPYKAFVSSTYIDLKDHRAHVISSLRNAGFFVDPMENWTADNDEPKNCSQDRLTDCDLCVLLVAFRRGYMADGETRSITQLEYDAAVKQGIDILPFLLDENEPWPRKFDELEKDPELKKWRDDLMKQHGTGVFKFDPRSIDMAGALGRWLTKKNGGSSDPEPIRRIEWPEDTSPYPGLDHFTKKFAPVFFGREAEVQAILDRMRGPNGRFIIVSGDSGTGKSSVIHAGVLPKIEQDGFSDSKCPLFVPMLPSQGRHPFAALMGALNPFATEAGLKPDDVAEELKQAPAQLGDAIQTILAKGTTCHSLVLFLDQMEELFTVHTPRASQEFLQALFKAAQDIPLWVLATIRSDHLHHCHNNPEMLSVLRGPGHYPLGPIEPFMLEDLIAKPAHYAGLTINKTLVRRIVNETLIKADGLAMPNQSNLPLLAFVLRELFEKRSDHELSEDAYSQVGGITGAVAKHAATVEAELQRSPGGKADDFLLKLFESLIIVNQVGLPTRHRPLKAKLSSELHGMVEVLVQRRLLRTEGEGNQATVSISHEKLFESWPSLKNYIDKNKKKLIDRALLESRAKKWAEEGRSWRSGLASVREDREYCQAGVSLTEEIKEYLHASRRARKVRNMGIAAMALLALGATWLGLKGYNLGQAALKIESLFGSIHVSPQMVNIPGGMFQMGDDKQLEGDLRPIPSHPVTIKTFRMGKYEVTFKEYDAFAIATDRDLPSDQQWGRDRRPVINVAWDEANAYAEWLSGETGKHYRLPTESEWEYAARSGAKDVWAGPSNDTELGEYAVFLNSASNGTTKVGTKKGNGFGLHDLSGNVWEWVEDCAHLTYLGVPNDGAAWLGTPEGNCKQHVGRGGSWDNHSGYLRVSYRTGTHADYRSANLGFRLAQDP